MGYLNKVFLLGRLGEKPSIITTQSGNKVVSVSLATSEYWKKDGEKQEKTEWHKLVFWQRNAELVSTYCNKGSSIFIEGANQTTNWTDGEGIKRYKTEVLVKSIQLLDNKQENRESPASPQQPPANQAKSESPDADFPVDDLPF